MEDHYRGVPHSQGPQTPSASSDRGFSELLQTAASAMASAGGAASSPSPPADHSAAGDRKKPSPAEVLSSAKVIVDAAMAKIHHGDGQSPGEQKLDKAKLAAAAGDVLSAARHYGELDEKNYGKYLQKAEDYLHSYHVKHSTEGVAVNNSTAAPPSHSSAQAAHQENKFARHSKGNV